MKHVQQARTARPTQLVPDYRVEFSDASCVWAVQPRHAPGADAAAFAQPLLGAQRLTFEVIAPARGLDALSVRFGTYRRRNTAHLWCELTDAMGERLARGFVEADTISDGGYTRVLDLTGIPFDIGAKYSAHLSAPIASAQDSFAVFLTPAEIGRYAPERHLLRFRNERTFLYAGEDGPPRSARDQPRCVLVVSVGPGAAAPRTRAPLDLLARRFPGVPFEVIEFYGPARAWPLLADADVVAFADLFDGEGEVGRGFDALCFELHRRGACTIFLDTGDFVEPAPTRLFRYTDGVQARWRDRRAQRRRCHFALIEGEPPSLIDSAADAPLAEQALPGRPGPDHLAGLIARVRARRLPRVAIVSVLFRKAEVIGTFLDHIARQSYPGEITTVLVDDRSPDHDAATAQLHALVLEGAGIANRPVMIVSNRDNLGNCASRLAGIAELEADIYVVIDCDCLLNKDFISAHIFEHWWDDVDVVVGPLNIESWQRDPAALVRELEADRSRIASEAAPQDPIQPDGFLNCITRNFSVKRRCAQAEPLFDLDFSYSQKPGSGFGWEDVEMGYRLYARGAVIRHTPLAFSVHASHGASISEAAKVQGSIRNFERLFAKHPEMALTARRWAVDTYDRLSYWAKTTGVEAGDPQRALDARFAGSLEKARVLFPLYRRERQPLRILTHRWHVPHQYELQKLPHEFTLVTGLGNGMTDGWEFGQRPLRPNVRFAPASEIDPRHFDVTILHFDENVLASHTCNGIIPPTWGDPFRWFLELDGLPKVAVCHGTPQFLGQYGLDPNRKHAFALYEEERRALVEALAKARASVVCNSWQGLEEWGFADARVIWHGFDPQEFPPGTYDDDVLSLEADRYRPHYRGAWELTEVKRRLDPGIRIGTAEHAGAAIEPRSSNGFAIRNFRSYVDRIRQFTVYLNTTLRSPMPRSRGEAMMAGVIPVCLRNHDVDRFIRNGQNGFYADGPEELADFVNHLFRNREEAHRIGAQARLTALDLFNHDRYLTAWTELLSAKTGR